MSKKIAFIITGLGMGGAERQVCDLADQFSQKGHQVLLIAMTGQLVNMPRSTKVEVFALGMVKSPLGFIRAYKQASRLINDFKPDVVHSHMVHANIFSRLLRLTVDMPKLICTAHSSNEGAGIRMFCYRVTDFLCDINTNVSQEAVDIMVKRCAVPANRIIAMHNGIDTERYVFNITSRNKLRSELGLTEVTPLILAVGRLTTAKDYPNLLVAFKKIIDTVQFAQLVIIGSGEEQAKLTAIVTDFGLNDRVHFLGLRRDIEHWMSAADVFVLSSAWEGFGLVVAEAMACERIVVATDCGGVKEVVGDCGILVPPKNSDALAKGLAHGLRVSQESVKGQGQLARERIISCYSLSAQAERWLELYQ
ncbi:glycosyltransferase [Aeromonas veronii]|uniref:glycosyltransferase n=1 Tax=Aeromonas veronii TaxID=654 RepID=UPI003D1BEFD3